ncbi:MAG: SWIM zinc finger domain-containing protein [Salinibacter sp.]
MPDLPALSVADVRNWTNDRYYERGEGYFREDRIQRPRREGRTLKALCRGSRPNPYRVEVTLDADGIVAGSCSCPIGDGGRCKHAVALLLTWVEQPDAFEAAAPLADRLREQSKAELIEIIQRLVEREPSLESTVDLALRRPESDRAVDLRSYAEEAFEVGGLDPYDYGYGREVAEALDPLLERGEEQVDTGHWDAAGTLYATVAEVVCDRYDDVHDEEGDLIAVVHACAEGLGTLLARVDDPDLRSRALEALLDIYLWNAESGGYGAGTAAASALREHTTAEERRLAADVLRGHLPPPPDAPSEPSGVYGRPSGDSYWDHDRWTRRALGDLLLDLERDRLAPEDYLALCRRTGHWAECTDRLLELGRFDEAADAAAHLPAHQLGPLLDRFVEQGAPETARAIVEARLDDADGAAPALRHWLYEHALSTGRYDDALRVARRRFRNRPSIETYEQVRRAAEPLGRWDDVRTALLEHLRHDRRPNLRVQIHLHEDDPGPALALVEPFAGADRTWAFGTSFLSSVADAVAASHPEAAIALYEEAARRLVDQRGRSNYAEAASLLRQAEALYDEMDEQDLWQAFIDTLYEEELHRLPAAQDEFEKADLL